MKNPQRKQIHFLLATIFSLTLLSSSAQAAVESLSFGFSSVASLSITADKSDFTLNFPDFLNGTTSDQSQVRYDLSSNNITRGAGVFLVRLSDTVPSVDLQAAFDHYEDAGGNAVLTASQGGFRTLSTYDVSLADKQNRAGKGNVLHGTLVVNYQAKITQDLEATVAHYTRTLTVTFVDT